MLPSVSVRRKSPSSRMTSASRMSAITRGSPPGSMRQVIAWLTARCSRFAVTGNLASLGSAPPYAESLRYLSLLGRGHPQAVDEVAVRRQLPAHAVHLELLLHAGDE